MKGGEQRGQFRQLKHETEHWLQRYGTIKVDGLITCHKATALPAGMHQCRVEGFVRFSCTIKRKERHAHAHKRVKLEPDSG
jgi:hypothetical protein